MSFSLALTSKGDLVPQGTALGIVYGIDKLVQDLTLWLTEGYGGDMMHPELGSVLESWIGNIITPTTQAEVQGEVLRVLQNYQWVQMQSMKNNPQKYSLSELLYSINDIQVKMDYDALSVTISISNAQSQTATVTATSTAN